LREDFGRGVGLRDIEIFFLEDGGNWEIETRTFEALVGFKAFYDAPNKFYY
jgi:hypothetical protein